MEFTTEREILLNCGGQWLALEGDYWPALLRLIKVYGLDPEIYSPPEPGGRAVISAAAASELLTCLNDALPDTPAEDLWRHHNNDPSPSVAPPHEYFSGIGNAHLTTIVDFVGTRGFAIELSEPGTKYCFLGPTLHRPGCGAD